jgi:anti-sigma B factor antagonist
MTGPTQKPAPILPVHGLISIAVQAHGDVTVVSLRGELDSGSASMLRAYLSVIPRTAAARVVVDLADLAFIDSTGLAVLVGYRKRTQGQGGSFALAAPQTAVRRLLSTTGLLSWFEVHDTVAQALAGAGEPAGSRSGGTLSGTGPAAGRLLATLSRISRQP